MKLNRILLTNVVMIQVTEFSKFCLFWSFSCSNKCMKGDSKLGSPYNENQVIPLNYKVTDKYKYLIMNCNAYTQLLGRQN